MGGDGPRPRLPSDGAAGNGARRARLASRTYPWSWRNAGRWLLAVFAPVLSRPVWLHTQVLVVGAVLVALLPPAAPLCLLVDETPERRNGEKIRTKGVYRDAVRSYRRHAVYSCGLRWAEMISSTIYWIVCLTQLELTKVQINKRGFLSTELPGPHARVTPTFSVRTTDSQSLVRQNARVCLRTEWDCVL